MGLILRRLRRSEKRNRDKDDVFSFSIILEHKQFCDTLYIKLSTQFPESRLFFFLYCF